MRGGRRDWSQVLRGDEVWGVDLPEHHPQRQELEFYLYLKYSEKFLQGLSSRAA